MAAEVAGGRGRSRLPKLRRQGGRRGLLLVLVWQWRGRSWCRGGAALFRQTAIIFSPTLEPIIIIIFFFFCSLHLSWRCLRHVEPTMAAGSNARNAKPYKRQGFSRTWPEGEAAAMIRNTNSTTRMPERIRLDGGEGAAF